MRSSVYISYSNSKLFVFIQECRHHPDLHSFPTRRSSDLMISKGIVAVNGDEISKADVDRANDVARAQRSEEHTSELQSPDHLVCRLLLEKKKNFNPSASTIAIYCFRSNTYISIQIVTLRS